LQQWKKSTTQLSPGYAVWLIEKNAAEIYDDEGKLLKVEKKQRSA
jgi:hypothetical protein